MDANRDPKNLHPLLRAVWLIFMRLCRAAGLRPVLTRAWSSSPAQDALWLIGRRGIPGEKIVTNAKGGQSWHNVERDGKPASLAFDFALIDETGKALLPDDHEGWQIAGRIAESLGLTWGGRWKMRDLGHVQMDNEGQLSLAQAMNGVDPEEVVA